MYRFEFSDGTRLLLEDDYVPEELRNELSLRGDSDTVSIDKLEE